uniref:PI3K/PI4K domain-containing protein n=1 Tax=Rhabditophanes sp. KR3021 TaxID=114890 RepID=A0AC35TT22_9BILA
MSLNLSGSKAGSKEWDNILIAECCNRLSKYIDLKNPGLIDEVSKFVFEIEKVNMLSDEKWIFVLNKLSSEFRKRVKFYNYHLKSPVDKSLERHEINEIATERLKIGSEPIFKSILDMYESTFAEEAVSTYDKKFIETYGEHLHTAISTFKQQTTINEKSFEPFNELMNIFTENRANKQTSLNSNDLNTYLSSMKSSKIPMPGQDDRRYNSSSFVCINSMNHNIEIISSLTRPKKVQFVGSDGSRNDFLVKGYEDLHLDERVMQILRICNQIINHKKNKRFGNTNALHAGNYSVTPLGLRSGLIKFVGNATPMFGTYYRWQKNYEKNNKNADGSAVKLSELFKKSVQHHCDADSNEKFDITDFRTPANKHAFVAAYNEVTKVIPKNLISNEIWKYSKDANEWWNVTKTYARNVAVMSVIGSLFGIGDRHLSNILINYNTGQITHVDYNVFFDKGKYLRVPEKVPFRLTRSIVDAMGPSKTEGIFKESCVHVLKCLKGADTGIITTVLDTFVYDPLVDWASVDEAGEVNDSVPVGVMFAVYGKSCYDSKLIVETAERLLKLKLRELKNHLQKNCVELEHALKQNIAAIRSMHLLSHQCPTKQSDDQKRDCVLALGSALKTHKDCYCQLSRLLKFLAQYDETYANFLDNYRNKFTNPFIRAHVDDSDVQCLSIRLRADLLEQMCNNITKIYEELLSLINYNINFNDQNMYSLKRDTRHNKIAEQVENSKAADIISRIKEKFVTKDSETCEKKVIKVDMII